MTDRAVPPSASGGAAAFTRAVSPRTIVRVGFLSFFLFCSWQLWRYYQWALGAGPYVARPDATAGFVPLGGLMSLVGWLRTGAFDPVMPASVVILLAAAVMSLLFKRGFCGFICPVGTVTSFLGWIGRRFNAGRPRETPVAVDRLLRVPKYLIALMLVWSVVRLPNEVIFEFQRLPYYATSDFKILYGLLHPAWGYWALAGFVAVVSLASGLNGWCRYLCPLGAMYGAISAASLGLVRRDPAACIDCKACDRACAPAVRVSTSTRAIRSPECDGCQDCVNACPVDGALTTRFAGIRIPWQGWVLLVLVVWLLIWALAYASGNWAHGLSDAQNAEYLRTMKLSHDF